MESDPREDGFDRALALRAGPALVLGPAGSGRSELIVRRLAALASEGVPLARLAVLTQSAANQAQLRERVARGDLDRYLAALR